MTEIEKRLRVLEVCKKYVGTKENPPNSNNVVFNTRFYGHEVQDGFDLHGVPNKTCTYQWCGTSVSEKFIEAGFPLGNIGYLRGFAGVPYAIERISQWGKMVSLADVQPGDIAFIDFNKDGRWDHVTILESKHLPDVLMTYEGNTASDENASQSNGGEDCYKRRLLARHNYLFVRPNAYDKDPIIVHIS